MSGEGNDISEIISEIPTFGIGERYDLFNDLNQSKNLNTSFTNQVPKMLEIEGLNLNFDEPEERFKHLWSLLENALDCILDGQKPNELNSELSDYVDELCLLGLNERIFHRLSEHINQYIKVQVTNIFSKNCDDIELLMDIDSLWQSIQEKINKISKIFLFLDRAYILTGTSLISLNNLPNEIFARHLKSSREVFDKLLFFLSNTFEEIRNNKTVNFKLTSSLIRMLITLQLYSNHFEQPFLDRSKVYYENEGDKLVACLNICDFMAHCMNRFKLEDDKISKMISHSTSVQLQKIVRWELFGRHVSLNLRKGLNTLFDDCNLSGVTLFYSLCEQIKSCLESMTNNMHSFVKTRVSDIVSISTSGLDYDLKIIDSLINFYDSFYNRVLPTIDKDKSLSRSMMGSFSNALSVKCSKFMEYLCKYIDVKMKDFHQNMVIGSFFDRESERISYLTQFINNREQFILLYRQNLSSRLLMRKCDYENEQKIMTIIQKSFGAEPFSKIEEMFKDVNYSKYFSENFKKSLDNRSFESNIIVISKTNWPEYTSQNYKVPQIIADRMNDYKNYYSTVEKTNKLFNFVLKLGSCIVQIAFKNGTKELEVDFLQTLVLNLFQYQKSYSVSNILQLLNINDESELNQVIVSLTCGNYNVLLKEPSGLRVNRTDIVQINLDFKSDCYRIKINPIICAKTNNEEVASINNDNFDRDILLDSYIVGFMKSNKTMTVNEICDAVIQKMRIPVVAQNVINRFDNLIARDYIRKHPTINDTYMFVE